MAKSSWREKMEYLLTLWCRRVCPNRIVQVFLWFCLRSERRWERPSKKAVPPRLNSACRDTKCAAVTRSGVYQCLPVFTSVYQCLMVFALTCFSLPLVKHGDIVLRILFHLSSLTTVTPSSKGPVKILSCKHKDKDTINRWTLGIRTDFSSFAHPAVGKRRVEFLHQHSFNDLRICYH